MDETENVPGEDLIVGIDLGTTNSLVAHFGENGPEVLRDASGTGVVPSMVTIQGQTFVVGLAARELALDHPEETIFSIKRLMGRTPGDLTETERRSLPYEVVSSDRDLAKVRVAGREFAPEEISALVLRELKDRATAQLGREVRQVVITVPAYFDDAQRQATRVAGKLAGLEVLRIVNEPTAAALAYGLDRLPAGHVVVYDLGGGTFDVSILEVRDGIFRVRSTAGDTQLGGDDFDRSLMSRLLDQLPEGTAPDPKLLQAAKQAAEQAKIHLSEFHTVEYSVVDARTDQRLEASVDREAFEQMIAPEVERSLVCCRSALADAELSTEEIRAVVLVGGSSRIPLVRREVEKCFGRRPYSGLDPEEVVALGAAVQADILTGRGRDLLLLDVVPLSLGLETYGGGVAKIILRNSPIPAVASDTFTTQVDQQTAIDLHVVQGERELVADCRSLARFKLAGLSPLPAGMVRVEVQFLVDENGILTVHAREKTGGAEARVEVVPSYGLTDEEVGRMVQESFQFARADMEAHQLIDLRNECVTMITATRKILSLGNHGLAEADIAQIQAVMKDVEAHLGADSPKVLKPVYDRFVEVTVPLAGEVMSEVARETVTGRTVDQVLSEPPSEHYQERNKDCGELGEGFRTAARREGSES